MRIRWRGRALLIGLAILASGCAGSKDPSSLSPSPSPSSTDRPASAAVPPSKVKIGKPYKINGVWYHPKRDDEYDETGLASWYGPGFHNRRTANGEQYDMYAMTAAHKTLPMPTWVKVTNLDNGRTATLRVNDRGPFVAGRIIDVSKRAAQELGFLGQGIARVRVQIIPEKRPDAVIAAASPRNRPPTAAATVDSVVVVRLDAPRGGNPAATRAYVPRAAISAPASEHYIQVASFADPANAERAASRLFSVGEVSLIPVSVAGASFTRVRLGPMASAAEAERTLTSVHGAGFPDSWIVVD